MGDIQKALEEAKRAFAYLEECVEKEHGIEGKPEHEKDESPEYEAMEDQEAAPPTNRRQARIAATERMRSQIRKAKAEEQ